MNIFLQNIGKRYGRQWIFRHIDIEVPENSSLAITGRNGSGKSTLLKIIAGFNTPSEGVLQYKSGSKYLKSEDISTSFSFVAPYQNLIEELTLYEHLQFHFSFRKALIPIDQIIERSQLLGAEDKLIGEFSSGMKQRLKLSLAFFSDANCLFLDEPTANLDEQGISWYLEEVVSVQGATTIIIASNLAHEYNFVANKIDVSNFISL